MFYSFIAAKLKYMLYMLNTYVMSATGGVISS